MIEKLDPYKYKGGMKFKSEERAKINEIIDYLNAGRDDMKWVLAALEEHRLIKPIEEHQDNE